MSKDQLSWDQLISPSTAAASTNAPDASPAAPSKPASPPTGAAIGLETLMAQAEAKAEAASVAASVAAPEAAPQSTPESTQPKRPSRRKKAVSPKATAGAADLYSTKNWGKLEFGSKPVNSSKSAIGVKEMPDAPVATAVIQRSPHDSPSSSPYGSTQSSALIREAGESLQQPSVPILSVSEINKGIRDLLEGRYGFLWLKGEISNFKAHTSGHFYFSLKDSKAQISAVMFRGFNSGLRFRPEDGMEVLVRGKITVYEPRGNYQIFCETMEPVGAGALQKAFEQLKAKLQREGLFDEARKRPLPVLPRHIAIVTSPTGAAIRDMLNVLGRRFKGVRITVISCKVQGDQAPAEIVQAIEQANLLLDVDVMIVGRGGGSIEDLWAFNDERVARSLFTTRVPVISAVGHEIDFTIADFVADLRAPTPSAAAELVVKNAADLVLQIGTLERALRLTMTRQLNRDQQTVFGLSRRLVDPQRRIEDAIQRCDELMTRLEGAVRRGLETRTMRVQLSHRRMGTPIAKMALLRHRVEALSARLTTSISKGFILKREVMARQMAVLDSLSPLRVLDRGFSMVTRGDKVITAAQDLQPGDQVRVKMGRGSIEAEVKSVQES